jgi:hypothetical protein
MTNSPGNELPPLEPPVTPRTPRLDTEYTPRGGSRARRFSLSPLSDERSLHADTSPSESKFVTPGPVREWIFRSDEVSTDSRSSTTDFASEFASEVSQDSEAGDGWRPSLQHLPPRLNLTNAVPFPDLSDAVRGNPRPQCHEHVSSGGGHHLSGIELSSRASTVPSTQLSRRSLPNASLGGGSAVLALGTDGFVAGGRVVRGAGNRQGGGMSRGAAGQENVGNLMEQFRKSFDSTTGSLKLLEPTSSNVNGNAGTSRGGQGVGREGSHVRGDGGRGSLVPPPPKTPSNGSHVRGYLR